MGKIEEQPLTCAFMSYKERGNKVFRKCRCLDTNYCIKFPNQKCAFYKTKEECERLSKRYPYNKHYGKEVAI